MSAPLSSMTFQQAKEHIEAMRAAVNDQFHDARRLWLHEPSTLLAEQRKTLDLVLSFLDKVQP